MNLDGVTLFAVLAELKEKIIGARIDKIYQPTKYELVFAVRTIGENRKIILSSHPSNSRVHLTDMQYENPAVPPTFCMLLRKHLIGGRIVDIQQPNMERIAEIVIEAHDELGDRAQFKLVCELMGKHSNIIFISQNGKVLDSARRVPEHVSRIRQILPGLEYEYPPSKGKLSPLGMSLETLEDIMRSMSETTVPKYLVSMLNGVSPTVSQELTYRAFGSGEILLSKLESRQRRALAAVCASFFSNLSEKNFEPMLLFKNGEPFVITPFEYEMFGHLNSKRSESISQLLDGYFYEIDRIEKIRQKASALNRIIKQNYERCQKKLAVQQETLAQSEKMEQHRLFGELIAANIYVIKKGMDSVVLQDYTKDDLPMVEIPLDIRLSPSKNSQKYFSLYAKARNAKDIARKYINENMAEISYLESLAEAIERCESTEELEEIRREMIQSGYIKQAPQKIKPIPQSSPLHYVSAEGFDIYVGKNNYQNDRLTLKFARKEDIWLHVKDSAGAHVIIRTGGGVLPDNTLEQAAMLAAWYSKERGAKTAVDYAPISNVHKPNGAKPGMVIYENYRTVYVTPEEKLLPEMVKGTGRSG